MSSSSVGFFFSKPAILLPKNSADFSSNVSRFARGVHGHQAIVILVPEVFTVDSERHANSALSGVGVVQVKSREKESVS